jgi:hypothetical protein
MTDKQECELISTGNKTFFLLRQDKCLSGDGDHMETLVGMQYNCIWTALCGAVSEENYIHLPTYFFD